MENKLPSVIYVDQSLIKFSNLTHKIDNDIAWVQKEKLDLAVETLIKIRDNNLSRIDCRAFAEMALKELGE